MKNPKACAHRFTVPIYEADFVLVVCDDLPEARRRYNRLLGEYEVPAGTTGLACWRGHRFAIFLDRREACLIVVAHEVFHITHRIIDWAGVTFDPESHEAAALLCGWLMREVCHHVWPRGLPAQRNPLSKPGRR